MPWRDFTALVASIGVVGLGLGATIPLTALTLDQRGIGSGIIGIITAISAFGILGAAPFVSRWVAGHGPRGCMIGAILAAALSTALMETTDSLLAWGVLRFVFGASMGVLFTIGEAWVNDLAPETSRGRVVARDALGEPLRMVGTMVDLTERPASPPPPLFIEAPEPPQEPGLPLPFHRLLGICAQLQAGQPASPGLLAQVDDLLELSLRQVSLRL